MDRKRLTITLRSDFLNQIDQVIDGVKIRNRSHAIEYFLSRSLDSGVNQAVIMAGGEGIKMRSLTDELPKALIPVNGRPLIAHTLELLKAAGIERVILSIGHLGDKIRQEVGDGSKYGLQITYTQESRPLGTARALQLAENQLQDQPFLVINGDVLSNINLLELIAFHQPDKYLVTMAVSNVRNTKGYGGVFLRGAKVVKFLKTSNLKTKTQLINAGIYVLNPEIFDYLSGSGKLHLRDLFPQLAKEGKLAGFAFEGDWFDISTPESYQKALKIWRKKKNQAD